MAKGRILAVDHEPASRTFYQDLLAAEGYHVRTAASVAEALERLREEEFDLVITELDGAGRGGLEPIEAIRRFNADQDLMVITGQGDVARAVEAMKLGVAEYLQKPINRDELLLVLGRIIFSQSQRSEQSRLQAENLDYAVQLAAYEKCLAFLGRRDLERLGDLVLDTLMELVQAEGGVLWLTENGDRQLTRLCRRGLAGVSANDEVFRYNEEIKRQLLAGRIGFVNQGAGLLIPLLTHGELFGLIRVETPIGRSAFGRKEQRVVETVGNFAAAALSNLLQCRAVERNALRTSRGQAYNMGFFRDHLDKELHKATRYGRHVSMLRLVFDNHRELLSRFLDREVDEAEEEVLNAVKTVLRDADILAESAPGQYYLLLPETDSWGALVTQKRIRRALQGHLTLSDLRKNMAMRVLMRSASCPADGTSFGVLDQIIDQRLERIRCSLFAQGRIAELPFWPVLDLLLGHVADWQGLPPGETVPVKLRPYTAAGRYLRLPLEHLEDFTAALGREILEARRVRGIVYRGGDDFERMRRTLERTPGLDQTATSLFLLGGRERVDWDSQRVVPIHIADERFARTPFLLYLNEDHAYALFGRVEGRELLAFHTADFFFVENMIAKLQDLYQLQARI